jgi:hypothetical protein
MLSVIQFTPFSQKDYRAIKLPCPLVGCGN